MDQVVARALPLSALPDYNEAKVELLLLGEEDGRKGSKRVIALTRCSVHFRDEENLQRCVEALRASDIALRNRPEELMLWNWQITLRSGMTITFGVSWYDLEFYKRRRNAFKDERHLSQYLNFGSSLADFEVSHFLIDD